MTFASSIAGIESRIKALRHFSPCDISDALLKLHKGSGSSGIERSSKTHAGHILDIVPFSPLVGQRSGSPKIIAPVSTFKFIRKEDVETLPPAEEHGFPPGKHWVDWARPGTVAVVEQPPGQYCAVLGGILAARMKFLGVKAAVINGRVRDLAELHRSEFPVWASGTSTVGSGAEAKPGEREVPITFGGVTISPGDIIMCDSLEGVVVIPQNLLDDVLDLMPKLVTQDEKVMEAVNNGSSVFEAMNKYRNI